MSVTIVDIARRLGLSDSTVSRVLNGRADRFISEATRERVLAASAEMGYRPNKIASALVTGQSRTIAFWVSHARTHYYTEMLYRLQDRLREDGYELVIDPIRRSADGTFGPAMQWPYDGIIVCDPPFCPANELVDSCYRGVPVVSIGAYYWAMVDYVGAELCTGAKKAVKHLLAVTSAKTASPRIAFVTMTDHRDDEPRYLAYCSMMAKQGLVPEFIHASEGQPAQARDAIRKYINKHGRPDGIFCYNDGMAIGVHRGLRDLGLRMPEDVALVGCDGTEETIFHDPAISTIDMNLDKMCEQAWRFLLRRIREGEVALQQTMIRPRVMIRASSDGDS